jgi:hypothetical protein
MVREIQIKMRYFFLSVALPKDLKVNDVLGKIKLFS